MTSSTFSTNGLTFVVDLFITAGAIALAEVLAESRHITHVDLKENDIRVAGLMALQLAHRMNHTLLSMETPKAYRVEPVSISVVCVCVCVCVCVVRGRKCMTLK